MRDAGAVRRGPRTGAAGGAVAPAKAGAASRSAQPAARGATEQGRRRRSRAAGGRGSGRSPRSSAGAARRRRAALPVVARERELDLVLASAIRVLGYILVSLSDRLILVTGARSPLIRRQSRASARGR